MGDTKTVNTIEESAFKICREILSPLVEADGGALHVVQATEDEVHIFLTGSCAGCPGVVFTRERVLAPALRTALPKSRLTVSTGFRPPEGAVRASATNQSGASRT